MGFQRGGFRSGRIYSSQMEPYRNSGLFFLYRLLPPIWGSFLPYLLRNRIWSSRICRSLSFLKLFCPFTKTLLKRFRSRNPLPVFLLLFLFLPFFFPAFQIYLRDHLPAGQGLSDHIIGGVIHSPLILEPDLHFGGMDIYIDLIAGNVILQTHKWILVLHHIWLIGFLNGLHQDLAFYIPAVDIIIFKIPVSPGDHRLSDKAFDEDPRPFKPDLQQFSGNIPAVDPVDHIFQIGISGTMETHLPVYHIFKRNILVGQSQLLHVGADIPGFCHGSF